MISLYLGLAAFALYLIYDVNSFTRQIKFVHSFFMVGTVLIGVATVMDLWNAWKVRAFSGIADIGLLAAAAVCFGALIYCLFFALPFEETYAEQNTEKHVYSGGAYALCRHPGILCFFGTYLFLGLAALPARLLINGMVFSFLNLLYAWFQDRITFPKTFCDYSEYQNTVPFLIPTKASIRMAGQTLFRSDNEEEIL